MLARTLPLGEPDPYALPEPVPDVAPAPIAIERPRAAAPGAIEIGSLSWRFWLKAGFFFTIGAGGATVIAAIAAWTVGLSLLAFIGSLLSIGGALPK